MKPETLDKIVELIYRADREELDTIYEALKLRTQGMRAQETTDALRSLKVGDVAVLSRIKPKYMEGVRVVITGRRQTKFIVRSVDPSVRFRGRPVNGLIVHAVCLQKIKE